MAQTPALFVKPGAALAYLATTDKIAGEVVVIGSRALVIGSAIDFSENPIGTVHADGAFDFPQAAEIIQDGDRVYWDADGDPVTGTAGSGAATATESGNTLLGVAVPLQANGTTDTAATDTYVRVDTGNLGVASALQGAPNAQTITATLTIANLLTKIITGTHAVGGTQTYTLPTGTLMSAGVAIVIGESFDWSIINLSAAAADSITLAAGTTHTIVGNKIVQSAHASTGGIYGNSAVFRSRMTAATTWITYRIA